MAASSGQYGLCGTGGCTDTSSPFAQVGAASCTYCGLTRTQFDSRTNSIARAAETGAYLDFEGGIHPPRHPSVPTIQEWIRANPKAYGTTGTAIILHPFSGGASHITTTKQLNEYAASRTYGDPEKGLYVSPSRQVDALLASGASRSQIEMALGLRPNALAGGTLVRIDIANPFARNLSLPTSGNAYFRPGTGLTTGNLNEAVIRSPLKTDPGIRLSPIIGR